MAVQLQNAGLPDRAVIAEINVRAFFNDPYGQAYWPNSKLDSRIEGSYARLAQTMIEPGAWYMKVIRDDKPISYARWTLPDRIWERLRAENDVVDVDDSTKKIFKQEYDGTCGTNGRPHGVAVDMIESVTPAMNEARQKYRPKDDFIGNGIHVSDVASQLMEMLELDQVMKKPGYERQGAASMLVQWAVGLAQRENLKIYVEATPIGVQLYRSLGFENLVEVHHDLSRFGGPKQYTYTMMMKYP